MRPAQKAPENLSGAYESTAIRLDASMRPAQKAPENQDRHRRRGHRAAASMRPAQKAPENGAEDCQPQSCNDGFNEAGAKSAGKRCDAKLGASLGFGLQ